MPIILVPQPSDDPNDPLNWPLWKRDLITFILSMTAIFATALGPILAANTMVLSRWFKVDFSRIAELTGYYLLGVGVAGFLFVPTGRIWGKRHLFVGGTIVLAITSAWGGGSGRNYTSEVWARILQGVATAPFESLVNAAVGDLYCVHVSDCVWIAEGRPLLTAVIATWSAHCLHQLGRIRRCLLHPYPSWEDHP